MQRQKTEGVKNTEDSKPAPQKLVNAFEKPKVEQAKPAPEIRAVPKKMAANPFEQAQKEKQESQSKPEPKKLGAPAFLSQKSSEPEKEKPRPAPKKLDTSFLENAQKLQMAQMARPRSPPKPLKSEGGDDFKKNIEAMLAKQKVRPTVGADSAALFSKQKQAGLGGIEESDEGSD